jgi:hypothetical protein
MDSNVSQKQALKQLKKIKALLKPKVVCIPEDIAKNNIIRARAKLDEYGLKDSYHGSYFYLL